MAVTYIYRICSSFYQIIEIYCIMEVLSWLLYLASTVRQSDEWNCQYLKHISTAKSTNDSVF